MNNNPRHPEAHPSGNPFTPAAGEGQPDATPSGDWLDMLLCEEDDYIDDGGFTSTVMERLPEPARPMPIWVKPLVIFLVCTIGTGLAVFLSPGSGAFLLPFFDFSKFLTAPLTLMPLFAFLFIMVASAVIMARSET